MDNYALEGSTLSSRDARYALPELRVPQSIDGDPHEALAEALVEAEQALAAYVGYAEKLEALTRSVMLSEAVTLPDNLLPPEGAGAYPETTYELHAVAKSNQAIGLALSLLVQARTELDKPIADSRRLLGSKP